MKKLIILSLALAAFTCACSGSEDDVEEVVQSASESSEQAVTGRTDPGSSGGPFE